MRVVRASALAAVAAFCLAALPASGMQDADRVVAGGGITVKGWQGKVDARAAKEGKTIKDSKFAQEGDALHLSIGPAAIYWNPAHSASGEYTVGATFKEGKSAADHPHSYGIFIGGKDLDADTQSLMYCVAYGNGTFLVRQFNGATVTTVAKRQPHEAVNKAGADGAVTNHVAWRVTGQGADCLINGQVVSSLKRDEIVGPGKLGSTDGVYGLRVTHNVDVTVTGFGKK
jgi:hypothetical protein